MMEVADGSVGLQAGGLGLGLGASRKGQSHEDRGWGPIARPGNSGGGVVVTVDWPRRGLRAAVRKEDGAGTRRR